uniref:Uncharacterized protein n=1 Tax=Anopheles melas TaxID=34690 RepID=A0A182THB0_9DIPT
MRLTMNPKTFTGNYEESARTCPNTRKHRTTKLTADHVVPIVSFGRLSTPSDKGAAFIAARCTSPARACASFPKRSQYDDTDENDHDADDDGPRRYTQQVRMLLVQMVIQNQQESARHDGGAIKALHTAIAQEHHGSLWSVVIGMSSNAYAAEVAVGSKFEQSHVKCVGPVKAPIAVRAAVPPLAPMDQPVLIVDRAGQETLVAHVALVRALPGVALADVIAQIGPYREPAQAPVPIAGERAHSVVKAQMLPQMARLGPAVAVRLPLCPGHSAGEDVNLGVPVGVQLGQRRKQGHTHVAAVLQLHVLELAPDEAATLQTLCPMGQHIGQRREVKPTERAPAAAGRRVLRLVREQAGTVGKARVTVLAAKDGVHGDDGKLPAQQGGRAFAFLRLGREQLLPELRMAWHRYCSAEGKIAPLCRHFTTASMYASDAGVGFESLQTVAGSSGCCCCAGGGSTFIDASG